MNRLLIISIAALDLLNVTKVISSGTMWNMKLLTNNQVRTEFKFLFCRSSSISGYYFHWSIEHSFAITQWKWIHHIVHSGLTIFSFVFKLENFNFQFIHSKNTSKMGLLFKKKKKVRYFSEPLLSHPLELHSSLLEGRWKKLLSSPTTTSLRTWIVF